MKLISSRVMESGEYSDLTVLCDDRKYLVHKVVVCSQSNVLAAAMKKGFKVMQDVHCYGMVALLLVDHADNFLVFFRNAS